MNKGDDPPEQVEPERPSASGQTDADSARSSDAFIKNLGTDVAKWQTPAVKGLFADTARWQQAFIGNLGADVAKWQTPIVKGLFADTARWRDTFINNAGVAAFGARRVVFDHVSRLVAETALADIAPVELRTEAWWRDAANDWIERNSRSLLASLVGGVMMVLYVNIAIATPDLADDLNRILGLPLAVLGIALAIYFANRECH